jgi:hypothetical protein
MPPPYQRRFSLKSSRGLPMNIGYPFGVVLVITVSVRLIGEYS